MAEPSQKEKERTAQLWAISAEAESKVENSLGRALDQLNGYNLELISLRAKILASQPMESGSVGLDLNACGESVCKGCPHARWVQFQWTKSKKADGASILKVINLSSAKKDPILHLKRSSKNYALTRDLIRKAKSILSDRARLIARLRALEYVIKQEK